MKKTLLFISLITAFNLSYADDITKYLSQSEIDKSTKSQYDDENKIKNNSNIKQPQNIQKIANDYFGKIYPQITYPHVFFSKKMNLTGFITCFTNERNEIESIFTVDNTVLNSTLETPETKPFSVRVCAFYEYYDKKIGLSPLNKIQETPIQIAKIENLKPIKIEPKPIKTDEFITPDNLNISSLGTFSNPKKLIESIKLFDKNDEFTKTSKVEENYKQFLGKEYLFKQDKCFNINSATYDADKEIYTINVGNLNSQLLLSKIDSYKNNEIYPFINVSCLSSGRDFIGSNSFGVKVNARSTFIQNYGISINNIKSSSFKLFSFNLHLSSDEAKKLKDNYSFYYKFELVNSPIFKTKILEEAGYIEATIDNPTELATSSLLLLTNIKEIGIFNQKTGQVLMIKKFNN